MATHSSVLAWRIPGTGESGGEHHRVFPLSDRLTFLEIIALVVRISVGTRAQNIY